MKRVLGVVLIWSACCFAGDLTTLDGKIYRNVTVSRVEADGLVITHAEGGCKLDFLKLPEEVRRQYNYDPAKAEAARKAAASTAKAGSGWDEIDQRMVFLTVQLSSVEASLAALNRALVSLGIQQVARQSAATTAQQANEAMDRNAGGPVPWSDFYGRTAEKFFYHPTDRRSSYHTLTILSQQSPNADTAKGFGVPSRQGLPVHQRPPQFDYIYRANADAEKRAQAEVARLGNNAGAILERRRQLEAEQSALWSKIAFHAVAGQELLSKPLYYYDFKSAEPDSAEGRQRLEAMRAAMDYLRNGNKLAAMVERGVDVDAARCYSQLQEGVITARGEMERRLMAQPAVVGEITDRRTMLGKFVAVAKRMGEVSANITDAHRLALDGDRAGDQGRKLTFRSQLQQSLMLCAEALLAGDECANELAREWKVQPATQTTAPPSTTVQASLTVPTAYQAQDISSSETVLLGTWSVTIGGYQDAWTFKKDGVVSSALQPNLKGQWKKEAYRILIQWDEIENGQKTWEAFSLPLNEQAQQGVSWSGKNLVARKAEPVAQPAVLPPPPPLVAPQSNHQPSQVWTNSLGMKFVPVPGTSVQFSIWDTRVQDYQAFVTATGRDWEQPGFEQGPTHPAVKVSWVDAKAFCSWLTEKERRAGTLTSAQEYRLPTDLEWSTAVGLENETGSTPKERDGKIQDVYPWGTQWPPPRGAGNYVLKLGTGKLTDFAHTSPVGSFAANRFGLFDMGGNVCQWCEDSYDGQSNSRVLRGGSWKSFGGNKREIFLSSYRSHSPGIKGNNYHGFRCVLTVGGVSATQAPSGAVSTAGVSPASTQPHVSQQVPAEVQDLFTPAFAALPQDERLNRVTAKLKKLNPGFDGGIEYKKSKTEVTGVSLPNATLTNLWPLRALTNLKTFFCRNSNLADLSPLAGMPLQLVSCASTQVGDLSPLRTMTELKKINCGSTKVCDLSPLKGMPLDALWMNGTRVSDLTPLSGMPLTLLSCKFTAVTDLSPLKTMPNLRDLSCDFVAARDTVILRSIKTLQTINGLPVEEFWKRVNLGESPQPTGKDE